MINIKRTRPDLPALQNGSFDNVKGELITMQSNKCYICERSAADTSQIEHFKSSTKYPALKHIWTNLFLACGHCNAIKNHVSDKKKAELELVDCTDFTTVITNEIEFCCEAKPREKIKINVVTPNAPKSIVDTVQLLKEVYNYQSESLAFDAKVLTDEVIQEVNTLLQLLHTYEFGSYSKEKKAKVLSEIEDCLSVESPFTAFKIWYIKENYPDSEFSELLPQFNVN